MRTCSKQANLFGSSRKPWLNKTFDNAKLPWIFPYLLPTKTPSPPPSRAPSLLIPLIALLWLLARAAGVWPDFCLAWQRVHYVIGERLMQSRRSRASCWGRGEPFLLILVLFPLPWSPPMQCSFPGRHLFRSDRFSLRYFNTQSYTQQFSHL